MSRSELDLSAVGRLSNVIDVSLQEPSGDARVRALRAASAGFLHILEGADPPLNSRHLSEIKIKNKQGDESKRIIQIVPETSSYFASYSLREPDFV